MTENLLFNIFSSDNDFEIPTLRLDMQATKVAAPFLAYGEQSRKTEMNNNGTIHFYVDDYRFENVFKHPSNLTKVNPYAIVEPNFSCYCETPVALGTAQLYKKRAVARYCQDNGIRVFVDLNVNHKFYKLNMLGVPVGWSSFCTRGYSERLEFLEFEYKLAAEWAGKNPLTFVIFGGGNKCRDFAQEHSCYYVTPMIKIKSKNLAAKKIQEEITLDIGLKSIVAKVTDNIYDNQLIIPNDKKHSSRKIITE